MARDAQISRVACCAAESDADGIGRRSLACQPAMTAQPKIRRVMRARAREPRDVGSSQARCLGQSYVTSRTCLTRHIHVRILQSVAAETFSNDSILYRHTGRSSLVVTCGTVSDQCTVGRILHRHGAVVILVSEPPIPRAWPRSRRPCHFRLYDAVMARRTSSGLWKHRLSGLDYPRMASRTKRKDFGMLFMRKSSLRSSADKRRRECCHCSQDADQERRPNAS
jgi:hypothetical protein